MLILFDTRTNNVKRFVNKLKDRLPEVELILIDENIVIDRKFHLVTYTTRVGQIPEKTSKFLEINHNNALTVSVSGNTIWGSSYGLALEKITTLYPNIVEGMKFELSGIDEDVEKYKEIIKEWV